jgi:hypothetical protein
VIELELIKYYEHRARTKSISLKIQTNSDIVRFRRTLLALLGSLSGRVKYTGPDGVISKFFNSNLYVVVDC